MRASFRSGMRSHLFTNVLFDPAITIPPSGTCLPSYILAVLCCCGMLHGGSAEVTRSAFKHVKVFEALKTLVFKSLPADDNLMLGTC